MELEQLILTVFKWGAGTLAGVSILIGMIGELRYELAQLKERGERW